MTKIIIDRRENKNIIKIFIKEDMPFEIRNLAIADFVIPTANQNPANEKEEYEFIGIERKTQNDFLNSIIDKRLVNQLILLKENFKVPLLIIEGAQNLYSLHNIHPNAIRGMLATIAIDFQIPILHSRNMKDTVKIIKTISNRLEKSRGPISIITRKKPLTTKEQQLYILESLPGIGPTLAESLLRKFKTIKRVVNASENSLQKIEKIGPKKAKEVKRVLEALYE